VYNPIKAEKTLRWQILNKQYTQVFVFQFPLSEPEISR
jgi:hypothetical protein